MTAREEPNATRYRGPRAVGEGRFNDNQKEFHED